ncbi:MAG TPA: hypothetical protein VII55_02690 [Candidatus Saccharimonadales bacterium]
MTIDKSPQLGAFPIENFSLKATKLPCADDSGARQQFKQAVEALQQHAPAKMPSTPGSGKRYGYYFRTLGRNGDSGLSGNEGLINGFAISRSQKTKVGHVEAVLNHENDPRAADGLFHLWLRRIIPHFSGVENSLPDSDDFFTGAGTSEIRFPQVTDAATQRLLDTFGLPDKKGDGWHIPVPQLTVIGSRGGIDGWLEAGPGDEKSVALVIVGERRRNAATTTTQFFEDGRKVGLLQDDGTKEILTAAGGEELAIIEPNYKQGSDIAEGFSNPIIRRQLGFVTLKRALPAQT